MTDNENDYSDLYGDDSAYDTSYGTTYDEPDFSVRAADPDAEASAVVSGTADDLLAWLWHRRGPESATMTGDATTIEELTGLLGVSID